SITAARVSAEKYENQVLIVAQKNVDSKKPTIEDIYEYGTLSQIIETTPYDDGTVQLQLDSIDRFKITDLSLEDGYYVATGSVKLSEFGDETNEKQALLETSALLRSKVGSSSIILASEDIQDLFDNEDGSLVVDGIANNFDILSLKQKYRILSTLNVTNRIKLLNSILESEIKIENIEEGINSKIKSKLNSQQREFYLREKLKAIKDELNQLNGFKGDAEDVQEKLDSNPYPKHIKEKIEAELRRFDQAPQGSAEANVIKNYIDLVMDLPYWQKTDDNVDINRTEKILDRNHYGLEKIKERIIEYLAVKQANPGAKGPILALVGPPGTGKTSLVISIAEALEKKYQKIALGGVRDEAEIRGHRKTYIGAMPGKIITAMRKAKVTNPLILLDEIDKMSSDFRGDPTSAMLEVLDYQQNSKFQDHFVEEEYDLSNVMFIATANYYDEIPAPLLDRLEIINLSSYTENEKVEIASTHLIPRVIKETGVDKKKFKISKKDLSFLIRGYTRESGVRDLQRKINTLARKMIVSELENDKEPITKLDRQTIEKLLKKPPFSNDKRDSKPQIGATTGLAWTSVGGSTLSIEVTLFKGKGKLILTGSLKDVMKESASIAFGYIKANAAKWNIDPDIFEKNDIHVHVPEGATPKDGPSAAICCALLLDSLVTGQKIDPLFAVTGDM
ncbi:MAG: endopeptidase La, partial [Mycoplasmataceae bacterium]|nr:endopeptidase La [Mycoplasmataceae bacterium]